MTVTLTSSPELGELATALAAFQADMPTVAKGKEARITGRDGGSSYSYKYADLADLTTVAYPLLARHGLAFTCAPGRNEGGAVDLYGVLVHTSGQRIVGSLPIGGGTAQQVGSSLTYMRRYLFGCLTGLVTEEDDDGSLASRRQESRAHDETPQQLGADDGRPMTSPTRATMFGLFNSRGIEDRDEQVRGIVGVIQRPIESRGELTEAEAQAVIRKLRTLPQQTAEQRRAALAAQQPQGEGQQADPAAES